MHAAGNGGGDPTLATDAHKGALSNGNSEGGPALATDVRRNNKGNGNVWWPPALGEVTLYGMDTSAEAAADNTKCCHEQGINKRRRGTRQSCNKTGVEVLGNATTNQTRGVGQKVET